MTSLKLTRVGLLCSFVTALAWGCSENDAELGSNRAGSAGTPSSAGGEGGEDSTPQGGTTAAGRAGSSSGGAGSGGTTNRGGSNQGGDAGDAFAGAGGEPSCSCGYPAILGGDCCAIRNACETSGVSCTMLRESIRAVRAWRESRPTHGNDDEVLDCTAKISEALVERCAFVPPECPEPAEDYATFGAPGEDGYTECTEPETRAALGCGQPGSYYGPECCQRRRCERDDDCESGRCILKKVQGIPFNQGYPHAQECHLTADACSCTWFEVGEGEVGYCIAEEEDLARFDCNAADRNCEELAEWDDVLLTTLASPGPGTLPRQIADAYWQCEEKISSELERRCDGPADCRSAGCSDDQVCIECLDPELEPHWLCGRSADSCPVLGGGGAGGGGGEGF